MECGIFLVVHVNVSLGVCEQGVVAFGFYALQCAASDSVRDIVSRFTRPRCKPAGVARAGFGVIL